MLKIVIKDLIEMGCKVYYKDEGFHRDDGPAIERADGSKEWWFEGQYIYSNFEVFSKPAFYENHSVDIQDVIDYHKPIDPRESYIVLDWELPSRNINLFTRETLTFKKILYKDGIGYIPNLPGL